MNFDIIPLDVIQLIAEFTGVRGALNLSECSRAYNQAIEDADLWRRLCCGIWKVEYQNTEAFNFDYKQLLRNKNGWFPLAKVISEYPESTKRPAISRKARRRRMIPNNLNLTYEDNFHLFDTTQSDGTPPETDDPNESGGSENLVRQVKRRHVASSTAHLKDEATASAPISPFSSRILESKVGRVRRSVTINSLEFKSPSANMCTTESDEKLGGQKDGRPPKFHWVAETPLFDLSRWDECPRQENVMDIRHSDQYLILTTAGWDADTALWNPRMPQHIRRCPKCATPRPNCLCSESLLCTRNACRLDSMTGVNSALLSPSSRWGLPMTPRSAAFARNAGLAAAIAIVRRRPTVYDNRAGSREFVSNICIHHLKSLELIQRLTLNTTSINCIDAGGNLDPPFFALGDDNGNLSILRKDIDVPFSLITTSNQSTSTAHKEINDLRLTNDNHVVAVKTQSRYPSSLQIYDLTSEKSNDYPPLLTQSHWIHAIELTSSLSTSEMVAVGESNSNGLFALLSLDMRTRRNVVQILPQTRQMLWPLRVYNHDIFANSSVPIWESGGSLLQFDRRFLQKNDAERTHGIADQSGGGIVNVYSLDTIRVEDFRCMHNHVYIYGVEGSNLSLYRSSYSKPTMRERLTDVDFLLSSQRLANVLKLFFCDERGWTSTCGPTVYRGVLWNRCLDA